MDIVALRHARFDDEIVAGIAADDLNTSKQLYFTLKPADAARLREVCGPLPILWT